MPVAARRESQREAAIPRKRRSNRGSGQAARAQPSLAAAMAALRRPGPGPAARAELLAELARPQHNITRIDELVDTLIDAARGLPFVETNLCGGPCRPVYTRGLQLWKAWTGPSGRLLRSGNKVHWSMGLGTRLAGFGGSCGWVGTV